jgi:hypothetical protein
MKTIRSLLCLLAAPLIQTAPAQIVSYTNFIRQSQVGSGVEWDVQVAPSGEQLSALAIDPGGARFELWTVKNSPLTEYLLDHKLVAAYVPQAYVAITSEDPYTLMPRTRADRPFTVNVDIQGIIDNDPTAPDPAKQVLLRRYVQSYGVKGTGIGIDPSQATMLSEIAISQNGTQTYSYALSSVPGADRAKLRGEERFTVFSLTDYQTPQAQLASRTIQIWPVADGAIAGITNGQNIRFALPPVTITLNDLYPSSRTYAQFYRGDPALGTTGLIVPGSAVVVNETIPQDRVLKLIDWDSAIPEDGRWTIELITETPFGAERLAHVTFDLDRTIEVNGSVTTME